MTLKKALAIATVVGGALAPGAAQAQQQEVFATTDLNIRAGPSPEFPVVTAIPASDGVEFFGCLEGRSWCDVAYNGMRGWAYGRYLAYETTNVQAVITEAPATVEVPTLTYDTATYWDTYYRDRPFYGQRDRWISVADDSTAAGATAGAAVGGPVGAVVGGVTGAAVGTALSLPGRVVDFVTNAPAEPVVIERQVVVGTSLPETIELYPVPDYEYRYAYVNNQRVLVEPGTRRVVQIIR